MVIRVESFIDKYTVMISHEKNSNFFSRKKKNLEFSYLLQLFDDLDQIKY